MDSHQAIEISGAALRASITPYGGYLTRLRVADGRDVVLGHASSEGRITDESSLGCLIGRHAGRIRGGAFELDGVHYQLSCNSGDAHLHGGFNGFGTQCWELIDHGVSHLHLALHSPDGHESYSGNLRVQARISIVEESSIRLEFSAETDRPTLCNLTWHPYFNLAGHTGGNVGAHRIEIDADQYLPLAGDLCPTGDVVSVTDTPFDLRRPERMNLGMMAAHPQTRLVDGYDHCFLIRGTGLRRAARVLSPDQRLAMELWTTQPALQFYTANSLHVPRHGKQGERYGRHDGFCLEAQGLPDASNHPAFPNNELRPGERYQQVIEYRFEVLDESR